MEYRENRIHGSTSSPFAIYEIDSLHPGYHMRPHWHPEHEIIYVISGTLCVTFDGVSYILRSGEVAFAQGGVIHKADPEGCRYICFLVNLKKLFPETDACIKNADRLEAGTIRVHPELWRYSDRFSKLCRKMLDVKHTNTKGYHFSIRALFLLFFSEIFDVEAYAHEKNRKDAADPSEKLKPIIRYIDDYYLFDVFHNVNDEMNLDKLAQMADMSKTNFCKCFKEITGSSPIAYSMSVRMRHACYALAESDRSITDIAYNLGFGSMSHFIDLFKKRFGMTPLKYRKIKKQSPYHDGDENE